MSEGGRTAGVKQRATSRRKPPVLPTTRWPTVPLRSVVDRIFVGLAVSRSQAKSDEPAVVVPVVNVRDISEGHLGPLSEISRVRLRQGSFKRFHLQAGDVLMTCRGTTLKAALVPKYSEVLVPSSNFIAMQPGDRLLPALLLALLRGSVWQQMLQQRSRSSSGLIQLTVRDLEDLPVPLPPLKVQQELAALIEAEEEHYRLALRAASLRREIAEDLVSNVLLGRPEEGSTPGAGDA